MGFLDKMKQAKDMYGNMKKIQDELDKQQKSISLYSLRHWYAYMRLAP